MWYEEKELFFDYCRKENLDPYSQKSVKRYKDSQLHKNFVKIKIPNIEMA